MPTDIPVLAVSYDGPFVTASGRIGDRDYFAVARTPADLRARLSADAHVDGWPAWVIHLEE